MTRRLCSWVLAYAVVGSPAAAYGPFSPPDPKVYARVEDQERARQLELRCTEADVGAGCYRSGLRLVRRGPCIHSITGDVIRKLPVHECYKMEEPRRYKGVWTDEFEGQSFVEEGVGLPSRPQGDPKSAMWREQYERLRVART